MNTDTPRTESYEMWLIKGFARQLEMELAEKSNEVARLREELDRLKRGCQGSCYACEPVGAMNLKLEAEVARLREIVERYRAETCPSEKDTSTETCPSQKDDQWRELGPDEMIQEGDERTDFLHGLAWRKVENSIGTLAWKWTTLKFRTLRPLPTSQDNEIARLREELAKAMSMIDSDMECEAEVARLREQAKLWHQHYRDKASNAQKYKWAFIEMEKKVESLRRALELIACPERPDGTYNRDRRACEVLAREALAEIK